MKFRVLLKGYKAILIAAILGIVQLAMGFMKIRIGVKDLLWFGSCILFWAVLSLIVRLFNSEKAYSLWVQIPVLVVLFYAIFFFLHIL